MRTIKYLLAILFSIAVAACGSSGGGGDGGGLIHDTTYSITGTVTSSGAALSGVTITLTGGATTTTDASGNYSFHFTGLANGNYTVTPTMAGRAFSPASSAVSVSGGNVTGTNFTATVAAATYSIAGTVSGAATSGVTITLSGANTGSVVTGAGGAYTISGLVPGSYTVTPSLSCFTFAPTSKAVTITAANSTANDFVATAIAGCGSSSSNLAVVPGQTIGGVIDLNGGAESKIFHQTLAATGGTLLSGYSWSKTIGTALPHPSVVINPLDGVVTGTSTTLQQGLFTLYVDVTDGSAIRSASIPLDLRRTCDSRVAAFNPCMIALVSNVHGAYLPAGKVGSAYAATIFTAGGVRPYSWTLGSGALPLGIVIDQARGVFRGTPTTAGTYEFYVRTTDSAGGSTAGEEGVLLARFSIVVNP